MVRPKVAIIDYGVGNLLSVHRAVDKVGGYGFLTNDPEEIARANKIILPGVGAFSNSMEILAKCGIDSVLHEVAIMGTPLLGICLGMQMLFEKSYEFGVSKGLGIMTGAVVPIPKIDAISKKRIKIPNVGWRELILNKENFTAIPTKYLDLISKGSSMYFVHSYAAEVTDKSQLWAYSDYGNNRIASVVGKGNIVGCQFHPEKSGSDGLTFLEKFIQK